MVIYSSFFCITNYIRNVAIKKNERKHLCMIVINLEKMLEAKKLTTVTALNKGQQVTVRLLTKSTINIKANFVDGGPEILSMLIDVSDCEP